MTGSRSTDSEWKKFATKYILSSGFLEHCRVIIIGAVIVHYKT